MNKQQRAKAHREGEATMPVELLERSNGMVPMASHGIYSCAYDDILDSPAALTLRGGETATLLDAIRVAMRATKNGTKPAAVFVFCHAVIKRIISRDAFDSHRRELVRLGFLEAVSVKRGTFRWCEAWRTYAPTPDELEPLKKQYRTNEKRSGKTPTLCV